MSRNGHLVFIPLLIISELRVWHGFGMQKSEIDGFGDWSFSRLGLSNNVKFPIYQTTK
jgi:hypothetical protein